MANWTNADILRLDAVYAAQGISMHARPLRAVMDILGTELVMGALASPQMSQITDAYAALVPEVSTTWPGFGIGIVASVDQVRKVTLGVPFGNRAPQLTWRILGFETEGEFAAWVRHDTNIAAAATAAATDMMDIAYGLDAIEGQNPDALMLWNLSRSNLEDVANSLPLTFSVDTITQSICLSVELALKAALVWDGAAIDSFKGQKGHALKTFGDQVAIAHPHMDDLRFHKAIATLPPYVASRYKPAGLNRLQVVELALGAQFVVASTLRRCANIS